MARQFRLPDLGEGITEGEIVRWLVKEGDDIKIDQPFVEVETDKAIVEMPSPFAGTVLKLQAKEKEIVKVGQVLFTVGAKGEPVPAAAPLPAPGLEAGRPAPSAPKSAAAGEILATPKVRKLAQELRVDLAVVAGTGPQGRVTEGDVRATKEMAAGAVAPPAAKVKAKFDFYGNLERIPLRGIRRVTSKRLRESMDKAVHVTHFDEADATELEKLRRAMQPEAETKGFKLSYLPFIVKAVVAGLKIHPYLNATIDDEDEDIILKKYYNIGIAVDVPDGLIVPVVKFADQKTVLDIAAEIRDLAQAARARTLDLADLKGGTFSITNVGVLGGEAATPIINYPEVAILATMKIADRVRVVDGNVVVRRTLPLCLSFDHRLIDGAAAARFTNELKTILQDRAKLLAAVNAID